MANPNPRTDHLEPTQYQESVPGGLGPTRGIRFPADIDDVLMAMPAGERAAVVRAAVRAYLIERGVYSIGERGEG